MAASTNKKAKPYIQRQKRTETVTLQVSYTVAGGDAPITQEDEWAFRLGLSLDDVAVRIVEDTDD